MTVISAMRAAGPVATLALEGACDGAAFRTYVRCVLAPALRPGDVVVLDNLAVHRDREAAAAIEAVGAERRFLPAYSPDLNPIERMWSKVKSRLRAAAPRTAAAVCDALGPALAAVTPNDWLRGCGYSTRY